MNELILRGYVVLCTCYLLTFFCTILGWKAVFRCLSVAALTVNGLVLTGIAMASGEPPVFEIFGGLLFVIFVLGVLGVSGSRPEEGRFTINTLVFAEILLLLVVTLFFPKEPPLHRYHHTYLWVVLFHACRCLALSFALFSAAHFIRYRSEPKRKRGNNPLFAKGRNFLLLSAVVFLCAEYAGIIWCQNGWGDFWHWSPAFFQATLIILCLMTAFHVPGKNPRSDDFRSVVAIMTPLLMLTIKVVKGLP